MRIVDFVYTIIDRFVPMDTQSKTELRNDANSWYSEHRSKVYEKGMNKLRDDFDVKTAPVKEKAIYWLENWAVRTGIAILFIFMVPTIQDWFEGGTKDDDDDDDDK